MEVNSNLGEVGYTYIGTNTPYYDDPSLWSFWSNVMFFPINTNSTTLSSTLTVMLGYQGWTQFNINLGQGGIATWANNCTNNGTNASCSASPFYTNNYFSS